MDYYNDFGIKYDNSIINTFLNKNFPNERSVRTSIKNTARKMQNRKEFESGSDEKMYDWKNIPEDVQKLAKMKDETRVLGYYPYLLSIKKATPIRGIKKAVRIGHIGKAVHFFLYTDDIDLILDKAKIKKELKEFNFELDLLRNHFDTQNEWNFKVTILDDLKKIKVNKNEKR